MKHIGTAAVLGLCAALVAGCGGARQDAAPAAVTLDGSALQPGRFRNPRVGEGVAALKAGDYRAASAAFNEALRENPSNPYLHFLNAVTYHLMTRRGGIGERDLADVGYRQALQFDPNGWWAAYGLGVLDLEERRYRAAQDAFAQVLLVDRGNAGALHGLAVASYYAADFATAAAAIGRAAKAQPDDRDILRSAALIAAANGDRAPAAAYAAGYAAAQPDAAAVAFVRRRIRDWADYLGTPTPRTSRRQRPAAIGLCDDKPPPPPPEAARPDLPPGKAGPQVLVDVTYIRSQDQLINTRGLNLLHGLQVQYGYSFNSTNTSLANIANYEAVTGAGSTNGSNGSVSTFPFAQTIMRSLTLPTLTYSLNIFNSQTSHSEIVARPTLMAQQGQPSSFFSGDEITVALNGQYGGTLNPIEVGVNVDITPTLVTDDNVTLRVRVKQSGVDPSVSGTFQQALQTSDNYVTATVTLGYDQTVVLSGLTARQRNDGSDRTPGLSEIPLVQYLFKNQQNTDDYRTLLIMLTPHHPDQPPIGAAPPPPPPPAPVKPAAAAHPGKHPAKRGAGASAQGAAKPAPAPPPALAPAARPHVPAAPQPSLAELLQQWQRGGGTGLGGSEALRDAVRHLEPNSLYRQLRAGDLSLEAWESPTTFSEAIRTDLTFLYY